VHELVHRGQQQLARALVEALEELEAAQLELGDDELARGLALGHRLREVALDLVLHLVEHLVEVRCPARHHVAVLLDIGTHRFPGTVLDELADVVLDEPLFGVVELSVHVPEGHQVVDDGVHFLLGDERIFAEVHHG
jgi:hypothetical protein